MRWRLIATAIATFLLGAVFGPVLLALLSGLAAGADEDRQWRQAYDLLRAHGDRDQQIHLPKLDFTGDITDCGYEPDPLFGPDHGTPSATWAPYQGYLALFAWRSRQFVEEVEGHRVNFLNRRFGPFEAAFLDRCIRTTLFADLCSAHVGRALEAGGHRSSIAAPPGVRIDETAAQRTICLYLDGIAARRGQPIADRRDAPPPVAPADR